MRKLEPRLEDEIRALEEKELYEFQLPVLIEHVATPSVPKGTGRQQMRDSLVRHAREHLAGIVDHLVRIQAQDVQLLALANAVAAELTPGQIKEMALDPDVKLIRLARPERVTA